MTADFAELRRTMVDCQIRTVDVTKLTVLTAFSTVPREDFVPDSLNEVSYIDDDLIVSQAKQGLAARYIMEPAPLAKLLQLADLKSTDVVLDIGAGTGYCAALLSQMVSSVIALESDKDLADLATRSLEKNQCDNVVVVSGKLVEGYPQEGPYDVIFIEGSVEIVPDAILSQLKEGGRLIVVKGHGNSGAAHVYLKEDELVSERFAFNLSIKPLEEFMKKPQFVF